MSVRVNKFSREFLQMPWTLTRLVDTIVIIITITIIIIVVVGLQGDISEQQRDGDVTSSRVS